MSLPGGFFLRGRHNSVTPAPGTDWPVTIHSPDDVELSRHLAQLQNVNLFLSRHSTVH